jgi:hypothetical protein
MDDDEAILLCILAFVAAAHQLIRSYYLLFNDLPTVKEKKQLLKRKREVTQYKRNVSYRYFPTTLPLEAKNCLAEILQDSDRVYMKSATHLHEWQLFELDKKFKI